jgi:methionyl aminopeptidase
MSEVITIKNEEEIDKMRKSGKISAKVLLYLKKIIKPGIKTGEIDSIARKMIEEMGAKPSFLGYNGYPASTCISINDEVVHGIPSNRTIMKGDLVSIDLGSLFDGYHSDTAISFCVGKSNNNIDKLLKVTEKSLLKGIKMIKPGIQLGDVQEVIQKTIEKEGFGVIRDLTGHGIGKSLQEAPSIPNYGKKDTGLVLKEGMTLAIEPMVSMGDWHIKTRDDGWTVVTADGSLAAHFEHTIAVTKTGSEILTEYHQ